MNGGRVAWADGGSGLSLVCPSADPSICSFCPSMGAECWRTGALSERARQDCSYVLPRSEPAETPEAVRTVSLFSHRAWLALRNSWVESGPGVREAPAVQGWCVTLRECQQFREKPDQSLGTQRNGVVQLWFVPQRP